MKSQITELTMRRIQRQQEYQKEVRTQLADNQRDAEALDNRLKGQDYELSNTLVRAPVDGLRYMDARTRVEEQNTLPCPDGEGKCTGREVQKRLPGLSRPGHDRPEPVPVVEDSLRHRDPSRVREAQTRCVTQGRG